MADRRLLQASTKFGKIDNALDSRRATCDKLIGMWGYTPVEITGVLVIISLLTRFSRVVGVVQPLSRAHERYRQTD